MGVHLSGTAAWQVGVCRWKQVGTASRASEGSPSCPALCSGWLLRNMGLVLMLKGWPGWDTGCSPGRETGRAVGTLCL